VRLKLNAATLPLIIRLLEQHEKQLQDTQVTVLFKDSESELYVVQTLLTELKGDTHDDDH